MPLLNPVTRAEPKEETGNQRGLALSLNETLFTPSPPPPTRFSPLQLYISIFSSSCSLSLSLSLAGPPARLPGLHKAARGGSSFSAGHPASSFPSVQPPGRGRRHPLFPEASGGLGLRCGAGTGGTVQAGRGRGAGEWGAHALPPP